ncbi:M30 family zinc metallopeptidase, partial [Spirochaeta dissipatitropha]
DGDGDGDGDEVHVLTLGEWFEADPEGAEHEWFQFVAEPGIRYRIYTQDSEFDHPDNPGPASYDNELGAYQTDMETSYIYIYPSGESGQVDIYDDITHIEFEAEEDLVYVKATQWNGGAGSGTHWIKVVPVAETFALNISITGNGYVERRVGGVFNNGPYVAGTEVELTAVANDPDSFNSWSGDIVSTDNPVSVTIASSLEVTADFTGETIHQAVVPVYFGSTDTSRIVHLNQLEGKSVFLVKANYSQASASESTGVLSNKVRSRTEPTDSRVYSSAGLDPVLSSYGISSRDIESGELRHISDDGYYILDRRDVQDFNAQATPAGLTASRSSTMLPGLERNLSYSAGDTRYFWVDDGPNGQKEVFEEIPATLRAVGDNSYIWIHDANWDPDSIQGDDNMLNQAQADEMRDAFELLYPKVTNLFGYEVGGGPDGDGGLDGDKRISILFYDISNDYQSGQTGGVLGYFWGKDGYTQDQLDSWGWNLKSNEMEIFYIDAHFTGTWPDGIKSTLAHEYQHMIHFAQKSMNGIATTTWFNEMLSMLAEDYLSETLETTLYDSHPSGRINAFNNGGYILSGVVDWLAPEYVLNSYASAYIFGAFLARNYGGAELLYELSTNSYAGINSINEALQELGYSVDFNGVVEEYAKTLVFPTGHEAVEHDFSGLSDSWNGLNYTIPTFDLFEVEDGPDVLDIVNHNFPAIRPYGFQVWSQDSWQDLGMDSMAIELAKPDSDSVQLYLMIR